MNTLGKINNDDIYEEHRAVNNQIEAPDFPGFGGNKTTTQVVEKPQQAQAPAPQKGDVLQPTPLGMDDQPKPPQPDIGAVETNQSAPQAPDFGDLPQDTKQAIANTVEQEKPVAPEIPVKDQLSEEGEKLKAMDNSRKYGFFDIAEWAMSPLMALGDAALAPISGGAETVGEAFNMAGKAMFDRLLPNIDDLPEDHAKKIVDTHLSGLPDSLKPVVSMGISVVTDPTTFVGLGSLRAAKAGMEAKHLQSIGKAAVDDKGILEAGVEKFLNVGMGVSDDVALANKAESSARFIKEAEIKADDLGKIAANTKKSTDVKAAQEAVANLAKLKKDLAEAAVTGGKVLKEGSEQIPPSEAFKSKAGVLARKADRGDKTAMRELVYMLDDKRMLTKAVEAEMEANRAVLKEWDRKMGFSETQKIVEFNTEVMANARKSNILDPDYISKDALFNIGKINGVKDIDLFIKEIHDQFIPSLKAAKGSRTIKQIKKNAEMYPISDLIGRETIPLSADYTHALHIGFSTTANATKRLMAVAKKTKSPMDIAAARRAFDVNVMLMHKVVGGDSEIGRSLRVLRESASPSAQKYRQLKKYMSDAASDDDFLFMFRNIDIENLSTKEFLRISEKGQRAFAKRGYDAFYEVYVNAILSGPLTHVVNSVSNTAMITLRPTTKYLESLSAFARRDIEAGKGGFQEANAMLSGMIGGMSDVMRVALRRANKKQLRFPEELERMHEMSKQSVNPALTAENFNATGAIGKVIDYAGALVRLPGNALLKEDKAFKHINYRMSINQEAVKASRSLAKDSDEAIAIFRAFKNNPDEHMVKQAIDTANLNTFTNKLEGKWGDWEKVTRTPGLNLIVPFFRTPTNILKFGARNSVMGNLVHDLPHILASGAKGDVARAKFAVGTLVPVGIALSLGDNLSGAGDLMTRKGQFKAEYDAPPYSLRVGDQWFSYGKLEPIRSILGLVASYQDAMHHLRLDEPDDEELSVEVATALIRPFLKVMSESSYLDTFGHIHYLIDGLLSQNPDAFKREFDKMISSIAAPNFVAQITNLEMDTEFRMAEGIIEKTKKRIWGLSDEMPYRPNAFGEKQYYPRGTLAAIVNPFVQRPDRKDKVADKMVELQVNIPDMTPRKFTHLGVEFELNTQQRHNLGVMIGKGTPANEELGLPEVPPIRQLIKAYIDNPVFKELPITDQQVVIENLYLKRKDQMKKILLVTDQGLRDHFEQTKLAQDELAGQ